jgi:hypothetical protein
MSTNTLILAIVMARDTYIYYSMRHVGDFLCFREKLVSSIFFKK